MSVGGWAGDTFTKVFQPVEKAVVQPLNKTIDAIIKNPIPTISTIALTTVGIPYPIANAAVAAANGGDVKNIALTIASAYAGQYAGNLVGSNVSAIPGVSTLSPEIQRVLATVAASSSGSATAAALSGKPLDQILTAATAGAVSGLVSDQLKSNNVLAELRAKGLPAETINNLIVNASNNATIAIIQGRSIADAVTTSTVATLSQAGLSQAAKTISDGYQALLRNSETLQAVQKQIDDLKQSAINTFNSVINPKQQQTQVAYDILTREYQDYLTETNNYNAAVEKYNAEKPQLVAQRVVYGPGWLQGGYIRYGASGPGERKSMPQYGYFVANPSYGVGGVGDIYVKAPFGLKVPSDADYKSALNNYQGLAEDFTKVYSQYQGMIDEINRLSEQGNSLYTTIVADSEALGRSVADYIVKENEVVKNVVENVTTTATSDVERELIRLFEEEQRKASTPSPYEPIAGGGAASDVSPTPLVPTTPGGSVTVTQIPDRELTTPTTPSPTLPSGKPLTPAEIEQFKAEGITTQEINDLINKLGLQPTISAAEIFNILNAIEPQKKPTTTPTAPTPTAPTTPPVGQEPKAPEFEGVSPPPEISETPLEPEVPTGPVTPPTTPTEPAPTQPQPTTPGQLNEEERRRELMRLLGLTEAGQAGTGTQPATGDGMTGGGIGGTTGEEGTSGLGGGEGTGPSPEDEGDIIDETPREPVPTLTPEGFTTRISTVNVSPDVRRNFLASRVTSGVGQTDSLLGSLLGTALTPTGSEPILGEDESKRKAVWNLESLRNALGI